MRIRIRFDALRLSITGAAGERMRGRHQGQARGDRDGHAAREGKVLYLRVPW